MRTSSAVSSTERVAICRTASCVPILAKVSRVLGLVHRSRPSVLSANLQSRDGVWVGDLAEVVAGSLILVGEQPGRPARDSSASTPYRGACPARDS